jgi:hypothetical protein
MNVGEGRIQTKIVDWLRMYDYGRDVVQICQDVYGLDNRQVVSLAKRASVQRALKRLAELNVVKTCSYRSAYGYICWTLVKRHPDPRERPKRERMPKGFDPKVVENDS